MTTAPSYSNTVFDEESNVQANSNSSPQKEAKKSFSAMGMFGIDYWQEYFNVNQNEVKDRLLAS